MCVQRSGGSVGCYWGLVGVPYPPSWPYRCNERVRNSNAVVKGHWYALGGMPYVVVRCAVRSMALYQEGDGKRKEGEVLLGDG